MRACVSWASTRTQRALGGMCQPADAHQLLNEVQRQRNVLGEPLAVGFDGVAEQLDRRLDLFLADREGVGLFGRRRGEIVHQPLGEAGALPLQVRHGGHDGQREPGRGTGGRIQYARAPSPDEWLLRQRAAQELRDFRGDLVRGSADPRIFDAAGFGQCRRRCCAERSPAPARVGFVALGCLVKFVEQCRIFVPG